jgi:hypothetical protein
MVLHLLYAYFLSCTLHLYTTYRKEDISNGQELGSM